MRKRGLLPAGFLLFLSADLLASVLSGIPGKASGQDLPIKSKFYALRIVNEKKVQNAKDSLGAPDGSSAEVLPGGQLVVLMEKKLYSFPFGLGFGEGSGFLDSGSVVGKGGADFKLEGWFAWQDTQGKQQCDWIPLGLSVSGFCLPLIDSLPPIDISAGTDMIRVTNLGTKSLFVDAVIGYVREADNRLT